MSSGSTISEAGKRLKNVIKKKQNPKEGLRIPTHPNPPKVMCISV